MTTPKNIQDDVHIKVIVKMEKTQNMKYCGYVILCILMHMWDLRSGHHASDCQYCFFNNFNEQVKPYVCLSNYMLSLILVWSNARKHHICQYLHVHVVWIHGILIFCYSFSALNLPAYFSNESHNDIWLLFEVCKPLYTLLCG